MANIENYVEPARLYRYRSVSSDEQLERELNAIETSELWFSSFDKMNDPMEGSYRPSTMHKEHPKYDVVMDLLFNQKMSIGICSLSETCNNEIMWAHYADQFKGICIEYSTRRLLGAFPENVDLVRLHYSESEQRISSRIPEADRTAKKLLSSKNFKWLYEREWRLLSPSPGANHMRIDNCVTCVFLGSRIEKAKKDQIVRTLGRLNIACKEMKISGYSIKFGEVTPIRRPLKRVKALADAI
jgi:hypothetical protein